MVTTIRTRYRNHPGSNVGKYVATAAGRQASHRTDQSQTSDANHRRAAGTLAGRLGVALSLAEPEWGNGGDSRVFTALEPWSPDEARKLQATARRLLTDHGHGSRMDKLTRENCGACALAGYGDDAEEGSPVAPNYAGWARVYIQAGRAIPEKYREGFRVELAGAGYSDGYVNVRYADALRRDILTFGGWDLSES